MAQWHNGQSKPAGGVASSQFGTMKKRESALEVASLLSIWNYAKDHVWGVANLV